MDKKFLSVGLALAFVVTLCIPLVEAASLSEPTTIESLVVLQGKVTGSNTGGVGIPQVKVILKDNAVNGPGTTILTDTNGNYNISSFQSGHFIDTVCRKPHYVTQADTVLLPDVANFDYSPTMQAR